MIAEPNVTKSTCCYCGVGCGVLIETAKAADGVARIIGVRGDPDHPANFGKLCTKGTTLHLTADRQVYDQVRVKHPELRLERNEQRHQASWDDALDLVAEKFSRIISQHGPDSVGIYVSGQLLTEDYYVFNKLAKGLIGTNNIDTNSRLCMSSAVAAYKQTLGADAPPCSYEDIDQAEIIFISGSNAAFAHPILFRRIEEAKKNNPELKLIVVDPRRTDTAKTADLFLQIQPGTDVALHHGLLHLMLWENWLDNDYIEQHTEGFSQLKTLVRDYTPRAVAGICGISEQDLHMAARWFAKSKATLSLYCQGLNQSSSGTAKNATLINLHLATGQIGKPGAGPFSLTGQPNAMGGREVGGLSNQLSAHRDLSNPAHRAEVAKLWGVKSVPEQAGLSAIPMFTALRDGTLKAIWIVCTNPAQSMPDQAAVHAALEHAEFVVVQEAYADTATVKYADVLLPAATWGEKGGTVTNSERRISRVLPAVPAYAEARADWQIAVDVARRLERLLSELQATSKTSMFPYDSSESIWLEHRESTRGRDLDITGLSYDMLETAGPQQWPMREGELHGKVRLYEDGIFPTASGRANFIASPYVATAESVDARFPIALTTGRLRDQWHGMSRTGTLARLYSHAPEACVEISARDAARLWLQQGELAQVSSRRGSQIFPVSINDDVPSSQAFIAMHWGEEFVSGSADGVVTHGVNSLTNAAIDPVSGQPELKHAAVNISPARLAWHLSAFALLPRETALSIQHEMRPLLSQYAFGSCVLFGREGEGVDVLGVHIRLSHHHAIEAEVQAMIAQGLNLLPTDGANPAMSYSDPNKGVTRVIRVGQEGDIKGKIQGVMLTGPKADMAAESWLRVFLETGYDSQAIGMALLSAGATPPVPMEARGKIVCNCFNVSSIDIQKTLADIKSAGELDHDKQLIALQKKLQCGTNCGSCLPELKQIIITPTEA